MGHHRGADHRGRAAARRHRGRGARARPGRWPSCASLGFANVRVETFDMPVWVRGEEKALDHRALPAAAGGDRARQQRRDPAAGDRGRAGRASTRSTSWSPRPDSAVRGKIVFVDHAMPRTQDGSGYGFFGRAAAGRADRSPAARARWRSSSARSAPTITATRIPACIGFADGRRADPRRRAVAARRASRSSASSSAASRCGCGCC